MPKKENIEAMFNDIAPTYDKLNHILSLGIDRIWRRKAVKRIMRERPEIVLDIACGTGDSSIALSKAGAPRVIGADISEGMLKIAREKVATLGLTGIDFQSGDALHLPFADGSADAAMIAFGVRNFEDRPACLQEILRVLRPGGKLLILELSVPQSRVVRFFYNLYFLNILPLIGKLLSGNRAAYSYLPQSVLHFPKPEEFLQMMRDCGYREVSHKALSSGLCRIFEGRR